MFTTVFAGMTLAEVGATLKEMAVEVLNYMFRIMIFVAILAVIYKILPNDPFRGVINEFANSLSQYSKYISWFIDIKYMLSAFGFACSFKYFIWVYRHLDALLEKRSAGGVLSL